MKTHGRTTMPSVVTWGSLYVVLCRRVTVVGMVSLTDRTLCDRSAGGHARLDGAKVMQCLHHLLASLHRERGTRPTHALPVDTG